MIGPGETLLNFDLGNHLWAVLSTPTPDGRVAVVSFTTHELARSFCSDACTRVGRGEHRWVTHESCLRFRDAHLTPLEPLLSLRERGTLRQHDPLSAALLRRIQVAALASPATARNVKAAIQSTFEAYSRT